MLHLILDIDGTLVSESEHAEDDSSLPQPRPHLDEFLAYCFDHFETASLWTAASQSWLEYIQRLILQPKLDRLGKKFHLLLCGERCIPMAHPDPEGCYPIPIPVKPLKKLWCRQSYPHSKHNTLIVDNTPATFCRNYGNAIQIRTYRGGPDQLLPKLMLFLDFVRAEYAQHQSVRHIDKQNWWAR